MRPPTSDASRRTSTRASRRCPASSLPASGFSSWSWWRASPCRLSYSRSRTPCFGRRSGPSSPTKPPRWSWWTTSCMPSLGCDSDMLFSLTLKHQTLITWLEHATNLLELQASAGLLVEGTPESQRLWSPRSQGPAPGQRLGHHGAQAFRPCGPQAHLHRRRHGIGAPSGLPGPISGALLGRLLQLTAPLSA